MTIDELQYPLRVCLYFVEIPNVCLHLKILYVVTLLMPPAAAMVLGEISRSASKFD